MYDYITWNYERLESYKHSRVSLRCTAVSPSSIEGPINNICLPWFLLQEGLTTGSSEAPLWELTSRRGPLDLLAHQGGRQVNGEGEGGLLGVLDDDAGVADLLRHHVLVLRDRLWARDDAQTDLFTLTVFKYSNRH